MPFFFIFFLFCLFVFSGIVTMFLWCDYNVKEIIGYTFHHLASIYAYYFVSVSIPFLPK